MEVNHITEVAEYVEFRMHSIPVCSCQWAPAPYDNLIVVNPGCIVHGPEPVIFDLEAAAVRVAQESVSPMAIMALVTGGWTREGAGWTHPGRHSHMSQAKAFATLLWEEGTQV